MSTRTRQVGDDVPLGHLELQLPGGRPVSSRTAFTSSGRVFFMSSGGERLTAIAEPALAPLPLADLDGRRAEDPRPDREDEAREVRPREEALGEDEAHLRVLPAQERLDADDAPGAEGVDRLVVQDAGRRGRAVQGHAAAAEGGPQARLELEGVDAVLDGRRGARLEPVAARRVRADRGLLGRGEEGRRVLAVLREDRDPDARGEGDGAVGEGEGLAQRAQHLLADAGRILAVVQSRQDEDEGVRLEPGGGVALAHAVRQAPGHGAQHPVGRGPADPRVERREARRRPRARRRPGPGGGRPARSRRRAGRGGGGSS